MDTALTDGAADGTGCGKVVFSFVCYFSSRLNEEWLIIVIRVGPSPGFQHN